MVFHLRAWILKGFIYVIWFYFSTVCEFSRLAKLARQYPVSCPTYLPRFLIDSIAFQAVHLKCLSMSVVLV